jgi:hypothetical protein
LLSGISKDKYPCDGEKVDATVLLAVKYLAELTKYVLLVRAICEKYCFEDRQISLVGAEAAHENCLSSQLVFFPNNPHKQDIFV